MSVARDQRRGGHYLASLAVAALDHVLREPGILEDVELPLPQPLDGGDQLPIHRADVGDGQRI